MNRTNFLPPFSSTSFPPWSCPVCKNGTLIKNTLTTEETTQSKKDAAHPEWEPAWVRARFSALLRCSNCKEPVFVIGSVETNEDYDDDYGGSRYFELFTPSFFEPALPIILIPKKCPSIVLSEISAASSLFWCSPSSSANRVRVAVERLMDELGIAKKRKTKKGTFENLTLNSRIMLFSEKKPEIGKFLLAIKWLGNSGSHSDNLSINDALDGFELLEHALEEVYESKSARMEKMSKAINKKKGPLA